MIVCTQCGNHNQDDDEFCGSCGKFLEWVGEKIEEPKPPPPPEPEVEEEPERRTIVDRVRSAVGLDEDERPETSEVDSVEEPAAAPVGTTEQREAAQEEAVEAEAEERRRQGEAEAQRLAEEAARQAAAEEEARRRAEEADRQAAAEEEARRRAEAAERERRHEEEAETRRRAQEEAARERAEAEAAEAQRKAEEEEAAARRKAEEEEAAARRKAEEEEAAAQRKAEEEARRAKEEADRRAAALLAKPRTQTPTAPPPAAPDARQPASEATPAAQEPQRGGREAEPAAQQARARQPVAQQPAARKAPRPAPKKATPERQVKPGDLICGQCGEGNDPQRRFCRKCGNSLAEAVTAARPPWWKRLFSRDKSRPKGGRRSKKTARQRARGAAGTARSAGWQANRATYILRRAVMLLALVGIVGAVALPGPRGAITDTVSEWYTKAKLALVPEYEIVNPVAAEATSSAPGHEPDKLIDGASNTYWAEGAPGPGVDQIVTITFPEPTNLDKIIVTSGASGDDPFLSQPRPRVLHIVYDTQRGMDLQLDDTADATTYDLEDGEGVSSVQLQIASVYPSAQGGENTAISEIEFRTRRRA